MAVSFIRIRPQLEELGERVVPANIGVVDGANASAVLFAALGLTTAPREKLAISAADVDLAQAGFHETDTIAALHSDSHSQTAVVDITILANSLLPGRLPTIVPLALSGGAGAPRSERALMPSRHDEGESELSETSFSAPPTQPAKSPEASQVDEYDVPQDLPGQDDDDLW
jgi:hypothetical protein